MEGPADERLQESLYHIPLIGRNVHSPRCHLYGRSGKLSHPPVKDTKCQPGAFRHNREQRDNQQLFPIRLFDLRSCIFSLMHQKMITIIKQKPESRPDKPRIFTQYQHHQKTSLSHIIKGAAASLPVRRCRQKRTVHQCHRQICTTPVAPENLRHCRKEPDHRCPRCHSKDIPFLKDSQKGKKERQIHKIISGKHQPFPEPARRKMHKPPFYHLGPRRIIPELRRSICIFPGKSIQIKKGLHICSPKIIIIPPADYLTACAYCHNQNHCKSSQHPWAGQVLPHRFKHCTSFFFRDPEHINYSRRHRRSRYPVRK